MRFKETTIFLLLTGMGACLTSEELRLRNALAAHHKPQIAFFSARDGNSEIYVMDADGKNQRRLTNHPAIDFSPSWSPDGKQIAFSSYRNGGNIQIFVMDSDGQHPIRLSDGANDKNPAWSPDGQKIAFSSSLVFAGFDAQEGDYEIYLMDTDGSNRRKLTDNVVQDTHPSWSPDGRLIAYESWTIKKPKEIHLITAEGEYLMRLSELHKKGDSHSDWFDPTGRAVSPVGNQITIWGRLKNLVHGLR